MQVSRDTPGTKSRIWAHEQAKPTAQATRKQPLTHPLSPLPLNGAVANRSYGRAAARHAHPRRLKNCVIASANAVAASR